MGSPPMLWRQDRTHTGSACTAAKSSWRPAWVAMPSPHRKSAAANHSLARRLTRARSTRDGLPDAG
eukprot:9172636-Lingulodinium_polyedra.AAC.1